LPKDGPIICGRPYPRSARRSYPQRKASGAVPVVPAKAAAPKDPLSRMRIAMWAKAGADGAALTQAQNACLTTLGAGHEPDPVAGTVTRGLYDCLLEAGLDRHDPAVNKHEHLPQKSIWNTIPVRVNAHDIKRKACSSRLTAGDTTRRVPLRPGRLGIFPKESLHVVSTHDSGCIALPVLCFRRSPSGMGDIAFTSFNADEDGWSIVALTELPSHSTLYFTDSNWDGDAFATNEGFYAWDTGADAFVAGTVIRFSQIDRSNRSVSIGTLNMVRNAALSGTSETLYAYLGEAADRPTIFLAAVTTEAPAPAAAALTSAGLTAGVECSLAAGKHRLFSVQRERAAARSDFSTYGTLINDPANWAGFTDGSHADAQPGLAAFSVSAVPEASMGWMMVAGLALLAARLRR
jgi:hypothetical protein